jgi:plastocyanin
MTPLSQNWHVTDDEDVVPVRSVQTKTVSRKPAAFVGIAVVSVLGGIFLFDASSITGQITELPAKILLSNSGLDPIVYTASPGETLTWKNMQDIPHYLLSDSLCSIENECMTTSTMFPGDEVTYTIPPTVSPGSYMYFSPTDPTLVGTISIMGSGQVPPSQNSSSSSVPISSASSNTCYSPSDCVSPNRCSVLDDGIVPGKCRSATSLQESSSGPLAAPITPSDSNSPSNPFLDSIQKQLELDRQTGATPAGTTTARTPGTTVPGIPQNPYALGTTSNEQMQLTAQVFSSDFQKPFQQPNTGPGTFIAILSGLTALVVVHRKASRGNRVVV